jgi:hypothetical protein
VAVRRQRINILAHIIILFISERSNIVQVNKRLRPVSECIISQKIRLQLFVVKKTSNVVKANMPNISSKQKKIKILDLKAK